MKLIGYFIFYLIFIFLESLSSINLLFPVKFDILIPAVIFSVARGGVSSIFFTVFFGLITGLSQGFVWININLALLIYLLANMLKSTFNIYSKPFIFVLTFFILFIKSLLLFLLNIKGVTIDKNVLFFILIYVLINGLLSFYLISFVNHLSLLVRRYEKNTHNP